MALVATIPAGIAAGRAVYDAGIGGFFAFGFFSVIGPFLLGILTTRHHIVIGIVFCGTMCFTTIAMANAFQRRIGNPDGILSNIGALAFLFGASFLLSLIFTVPMMLFRRQSDRYSISPDRSPQSDPKASQPGYLFEWREPFWARRRRMPRAIKFLKITILFLLVAIACTIIVIGIFLTASYEITLALMAKTFVAAAALLLGPLMLISIPSYVLVLVRGVKVSIDNSHVRVGSLQFGFNSNSFAIEPMMNNKHLLKVCGPDKQIVWIGIPEEISINSLDQLIRERSRVSNTQPDKSD